MDSKSYGKPHTHTDGQTDGRYVDLPYIYVSSSGVFSNFATVDVFRKPDFWFYEARFQVVFFSPTETRKYNNKRKRPNSKVLIFY